MSLLNIKDRKIKKILTISPLYGNTQKLQKIFDLYAHYDLIILNGNITYPYDQRIFDKNKDIINNMLQSKKVIYNIGNLDYKISLTEEAVRSWLKGKPNLINLSFAKGTNLVITSGGINPNMNSLCNTVETSFVNKIHGKLWHKTYGGKFGYVISNMPLIAKPPSFYMYSARIGTPYNNNFIAYGQEADENGLLNNIEL